MLHRSLLLRLLRLLLLTSKELRGDGGSNSLSSVTGSTTAVLRSMCLLWRGVSQRSATTAHVATTVESRYGIISILISTRMINWGGLELLGGRNKRHAL
jgi:hypothetical protein